MHVGSTWALPYPLPAIWLLLIGLFGFLTVYRRRISLWFIVVFLYQLFYSSSL